MSLNIKELNTVSTFLLPCLKIDPRVLKPRLLNTYLYDEDVDNYKEGYLTVVHSNYQDRDFKVFEKMLLDHPCFVDSYDISKTSYSAKVFKPEKFFDKSYKKFLEGKYSQFDLLGRSASLGFFSVAENPKVLAHVFFRSKELRKLKEQSLGIVLKEDSELWSKWSKEKDVLTPEIKEALIKTNVKPNNDFLNET